MKYKIDSCLNDGLDRLAPITVEINDLNDPEDVDTLCAQIMDDMVNDYGEPFGVGFTITIERVE